MVTLLLALSVLALPAQAQQRAIPIYTGTGFFLSAYGDLITNAHVVSSCRASSYWLTGAVESRAKLIAMDRKHDLALLRAEQGTPDSARLAAAMGTIQPGDRVTVMGYSHEKGDLQEYRVAHAHIRDLSGPSGEPEMLKFSSAAQQGNSGGPLLDEAGNVIGVVMGAVSQNTLDAGTRQSIVMDQYDIAISLPTLKAFLGKHNIRYQQADSRVRRSDSHIEARARDFIAKVHCVAAK